MRLQNIISYWLILLVIGLLISCRLSSDNQTKEAAHKDSIAVSLQSLEIFLKQFEKYTSDYHAALIALGKDSSSKDLNDQCINYSLKVHEWASRWQKLATIAEQYPELLKKFQDLNQLMMDAVNQRKEEVLVDGKLWMKKNLNVEQFRNGDPVFYARTNEEWNKAGKYKQPAYCYYENNPVYGILYGKLYNWYAVDDPRGLSPQGWHIPTDTEWSELTKYLGGEEVTGSKIKSKHGWSESGNGINSSELSVLPGGYDYYMGNFKYAGLYGSCWSSTQLDSLYAWGRIVYYFSDYISRNNFNKGYGFSVRCVKD